MNNRKYVWISTGVVVVLWAVIAGIVDFEVKMPSPWVTLQALYRIMTDPKFLFTVLVTVRRAMVGFIIAFASAVVLGIASGISNVVYYLLRPIILAQRSIPTMAVILVALIWIGREAAPILVCILVIFPVIYGAVVNGIRNVDRQLLEMAEVYKLSRGQKLTHLYLPSIRSSLMSVTAAAISLNLKITIAAEILGQSGKGIGNGFLMEKIALDTAGIFAWAIVAVVLGAVFEYLVSPRFLGMFFKGLRHE